MVAGPRWASLERLAAKGRWWGQVTGEGGDSTARPVPLSEDGHLLLLPVTEDERGPDR